MNMDDPVWDVTVFTKNRERLLAGDIATSCVERVRSQQLLSNEHFTVDGTLIGVWSGVKSFKKKVKAAASPNDPGNPTINFQRERWGTFTHVSAAQTP